MCGGAVELVPCSRVGHYFKPVTFSFDAKREEVELQNNMRTASAWMDEYKIYFDSLIPGMLDVVKNLFFIIKMSINFRAFEPHSGWKY